MQMLKKLKCGFYLISEYFRLSTLAIIKEFFHHCPFSFIKHVTSFENRYEILFFLYNQQFLKVTEEEIVVLRIKLF